MPNTNWRYYAAYAVLVIGAGAALVMGERPLSSTVVTWALFSFNLAAIIFLVPTILNFVTQIRNDASTNSEVRAALSDLKGQLEILQQKVNADKVTLGSALTQTAANSPLTAKAVVSATTTTPAKPTVAQTLTQAATLAASAANTPAAAESIFGKHLSRPIFAQKPAPQTATNAAPPPTAASTATTAMSKPQQMGLFGAGTTAAQLATSNNNLAATVQNLTAQAPGTPAAEEPNVEAGASGNALPLQEAMPATATDAATDNGSAEANAQPGDIALLVSATIDEDDVLCLRGEGGGLNWQEGVPMTYEGNDRWSFKVMGTAAPLICRIYLNDEISAFGEDLVLQPGQTLDIAPSFPKIEA